MYEMRRQYRGKFATDIVAHDPSERTPKACAVGRAVTRNDVTDRILPKKKAMCGIASLILDYETATEYATTRASADSD